MKKANVMLYRLATNNRNNRRYRLVLVLDGYGRGWYLVDQL